MNIVFLDIDGVLNNFMTTEKSPMGFTGIDSDKVSILSKVVKGLNAVIVLTTDWKLDWDFDKTKCTKDGLYMENKLKEFGLNIYGKTYEEKQQDRCKGIMEWMNNQKEKIDKFIILDDNEFDISLYNDLSKHFILTLDGIENSVAFDIKPSEEVLFCLDIIENSV